MSDTHLPLRPAAFTCATLPIETNPELLSGLACAFVETRLSSCSRERFHLSHDEALAEGLDPDAALHRALFDAAVNEMILEAVAEAVERAKIERPELAKPAAP